jgi:hypothetical protein
MKLNNYFKPTPKKWRVIGDTLLIISTSFSGYEFMNNEKEIGFIFLCVGVLGKVITNFANETEQN